MFDESANNSPKWKQLTLKKESTFNSSNYNVSDINSKDQIMNKTDMSFTIGGDKLPSLTSKTFENWNP